MPTAANQRNVKAKDMLTIDSPEAVKALVAKMDTDRYYLVRPGQSRIETRREDIGKELPGLLARNRVVAILSTRTIYLADNAFRFGRGQEAARLREAENRVMGIKRQIHDWQQQEAEATQQIASLKAAASGDVIGRSLDEIVKEVEGWDDVIDLTYGPGIDGITGEFIPPGTLIITFTPVAYDGHDNRDYGGDRGKYALTTPVRLRCDEQGGIHSMAETAHPHASGGGFCGGTVNKLYATMVANNDVVGGLDLLRLWSFSHNERDYQDRNFFTRSWAWWQEFFLDKKQAEKWLFGGKWDGATIRIPKQDQLEAEKSTVEALFGHSLEDVIHVGTGRNYLSKTDVTNYVKSKKDAEVCHCGAKGQGCACHGNTCSACRLPENQCWCPPLDKENATAYAVYTSSGHYIERAPAGPCRDTDGHCVDPYWTIPGIGGGIRCVKHLAIALARTYEVVATDIEAANKDYRTWEALPSPRHWRLIEGQLAKYVAPVTGRYCEVVKAGGNMCQANAPHRLMHRLNGMNQPQYFCDGPDCLPVNWPKTKAGTPRKKPASAARRRAGVR